MKSSQDALAIVPYLQPVPLSHIPLSIDPAISDDSGSENSSTDSEYGFYNSDSDNLLNAKLSMN